MKYSHSKVMLSALLISAKCSFGGFLIKRSDFKNCFGCATVFSNSKVAGLFFDVVEMATPPGG